MIKLNVNKVTSAVKSKRKVASQIMPKTSIATQLVPVLLRRGEREEFFHVPLCHVCRKPILDFELANVVVFGNEREEAPEILGTVDGAQVSRIPGVAVVVHLDCDQKNWKPWVRASSVFCSDQRGPLDKVWNGESL
jgi:hypothetical protein